VCETRERERERAAAAAVVVLLTELQFCSAVPSFILVNVTQNRTAHNGTAEWNYSSILRTRLITDSEANTTILADSS
jgi:hypothetical protein